MEIKEALSKLKESPEFKEWRRKNKADYFSYAFCELGDNEGEWQIGYYDKKEEKITTFIVNEKIKILPQQDVFKKPCMDVNKIGLENVKLTFAEIVDRASEFQKEKYSNEDANKTIAILQNLEEFGDIWNMTFITKSFSTLNLKVNAENGRILEHKLSSILDLRKE